MNCRESMLRAFGGARLIGDKWVRILYLDESGIGNLKSDPILIVAGVIIHADTQWASIANKLNKILADATPIGMKRPTCLHATDIFHGLGEFARENWDQNRRLKLLDEVGSIIETERLPVVWAAQDRREFARLHPTSSPSELLRDAYTASAVGCLMQSEVYMRQSTNKAEVMSVVMEQNHELQRRIPEMVSFMRDPAEQADSLLPGWNSVMPLQKIIDTPACQPKTASSILQLADYCAFAIKRRAQNRPDGPRLVGPIAANMLKLQMGNPLWNPVHLPDFWPKKVQLKEGKFISAD